MRESSKDRRTRFCGISGGKELPHIAIVTGQFQLRNSVHFCWTRGIRQKDRFFIIQLEGIAGADFEIVSLAEHLGLSNVTFISPPKTANQSGWPPNLLSVENLRRWTRVRAPGGSATLARLIALLIIRIKIQRATALAKTASCFVVGNPGIVTPFLAMLVREDCLTIVDDGLAALEHAERRRRRRGSLIPGVELFTPPLLWSRTLRFYTFFEDIYIGGKDLVERNTRLEGISDAIRVQGKSCWILGTPAVDAGGMAYVDFLSFVTKIVTRSRNLGLQIAYLPHRREEKETVRRLGKDVDMQVFNRATDVEQLVMDSRQTPEAIIGFGSTALETLLFLIPSGCTVWNIYLCPPRSKVGADSPDQIFIRHQKNPRINTTTVDAFLEDGLRIL